MSPYWTNVKRHIAGNTTANAPVKKGGGVEGTSSAMIVGSNPAKKTAMRAKGRKRTIRVEAPTRAFTGLDSFIWRSSRDWRVGRLTAGSCEVPRSLRGAALP